jgi:hypothetical protein
MEHPGRSVPRDCYEPPGEALRAATDPKNEAVSYTWGSPANPETAQVIGSNGVFNGTVQIGQNLGSALHHFRYPSQVRTLWIDAICINQSDLAERSAQVTRMRHIYSLAERVMVWLGPGDASSSLAFSRLDYLGSLLTYTKYYHTLPNPDCPGDKTEWCDYEFPLPYDEATWQAINTLCQRPWFGRIWVMQEVQLANSYAIVQCGHDMASWSRFRGALLAIDNRVEDIPAHLDIGMAASMCRDMLTVPLQRILLAASMRACGDDRDRIYGIS